MNIFKTAPIHLLGVGILVILALASYLLGIRPSVLTAEELRLVFAETKQLQDQVDQLEAENTSLRAKIDAKRATIKHRYTLTTSENQPLLETVSQLMTSCDLELLNFRETSHAERQESELQLAGNYHNLMRLLYDLRRLDQPARIVSLSLSPSQEGREAITSKIKIEFAPRSVLLGNMEGRIGVNQKES